jgi:hypothetical protein
MSLSMKRKVEKALAGYLPGVLTDGPEVYEGHDPEVDMSFPALVVYSENATAHPEMPVETGSKVVAIRMKFLVDSRADGGRVDLDMWREEIEAAMRCTEDIQAALNAPASGPDPREVQQIHFHEIRPAGEPSDRVETDWDEELNFEVICEPLAA